MREAEEVVECLDQAILRGQRDAMTLDLEEAKLAGSLLHLCDDLFLVPGVLRIQIRGQVDKWEGDLAGHDGR